jgi:hypothetical protein
MGMHIYHRKCDPSPLVAKFRILVSLWIHKTVNTAPILRRSVPAKCHTISRFTCKFNLTLAHKKHGRP